MPSQIVQCANFVTPRSGGLRTAMRHLATGYTDAGHQVVQIVPGERDGVEEAVWGSIHYVRSPAMPGTGYRVVTDPRRVTKLLDRLGPDRIEVHDRLTLRGLGTWAQHNGVGSMVISHERLDRLVRRWLPPTPGLRPLVNVSNRRLADGFDSVVATTEWAAEEFVRLKVPNLARIPLGVELDVFTPARHDASLRNRLVEPGEALLVSAVRLSPEKAPMRLVETVAELQRRGRAVRLVVAGDGPLRARLQRAAAGLPISFLGFVSGRGELARLLATADVVVAPGPIETFGLAALEALSAGTPVVVDEASALPEVIGTAGLAVPGNSSSFAAAIETLLELPSGPTRAAARARAEEFPWHATVDGFLGAHGLLPDPVGVR